MKFFVYILKCNDGTFYTGYSIDIIERVKAHNDSKIGAKYTRSRRPVSLVYSERFNKKESAMKREAEIKKLTRKEKITLINSKPAVD